MGRHSTPNNIKEMNGERDKRRYNPEGLDVEKLDCIPAAPHWFDIEQKKIYEKKAQWLINLKLLTAMDVDYLIQLCLLENKMLKKWQSGDAPNMSMYTQYDKFSSKLGFTVIDRQKMPAQEDKEGNKWGKRK